MILSSGSFIFWTKTWKLGMILRNVYGNIIGCFLINISLSNLFPNMPLSERFHIFCQAAFGHL